MLRGKARAGGNKKKHHRDDHIGPRQKLSKVEKLAKRIDDRFYNRMEIILDTRIAFVNGCREYALKRGDGAVQKMKKDSLKAFAKKAKKDLKRSRQGLNAYYVRFKKIFGFVDKKEQLYLMCRLAEKVSKKNTVTDWFFYQDFNANYTKVVSTYPWQRNGLRVALTSMLLYYILTPVFFCYISRDDEICVDLDDNPLDAWIGSFYFASVNLSGVGYGTQYPSKDTYREVIAGMFYVMISTIMLIVVITSLLELESFNKGDDWFGKCVTQSKDPNEFLHLKVRRFKMARYLQAYVGFSIVTAIGFFANTALVAANENYEDSGDSFLEILLNLHWAIQTTTTLGYGDVSAELYSGTRAQRVFLIFYLIIATGFVAKALGILASLGTDVNDMRRKAAWERRSISQAMINEIDADGDGQIDEYEYVIASLVQLRTVELGDVTEIMDKFRKLAKGGKTLHIGLQDNNEDGDDDGTEAGDSDDESGDDGDESGDDGDESDDDEGDDSV